MSARLLGLVIVCVAMLAVSPWMGGDLAGEHGHFILLQLRVPRVLLGAIVGAMLGLTGAVYQALFDNPLATPSTVGTTAGAALGALAVTFAIAAIAASGRARINDVLLAGIAITLATGAVTTGLQFHADMASTFEAVRWSLVELRRLVPAPGCGMLM